MGRVLALLLGALHFASLVAVVTGAGPAEEGGAGGGHCESVFRGFSDCLLKLGDNMANYPQDLDDHQNLHRICSYWDDFHSCATTALADCQEGATEMWEKLKDESRSLDFRGSLFELCHPGNSSPPSGRRPGPLTAGLVLTLILLY